MMRRSRRIRRGRRRIGEQGRPGEVGRGVGVEEEEGLEAVGGEVVDGVSKRQCTEWKSRFADSDFSGGVEAI